MSKTGVNLPRVDKTVQELFPGLTGRQVDEAISVGWITQEGKKVAKGDRLLPSSLDFSELEKALQEIKKGNSRLSLQVVWENLGAWIVDKVPGMPSHPLSLFDKNTVTQWALAQDSEVGKSFQDVQPTVTPHRLDTGTSGLLVVCKNVKAYEEWRNLFQSQKIQKTYLAWCFGEVKEKLLEIKTPIAHHSTDSRKMIEVKGLEKYRPPLLEAETTAQWIKSEEELSLWEIRCRTGVTHQVRVHMSGSGHPLVGDALYDPDYENRILRPAHHQLRAIELKWDNRVVRADSEKFASKESFTA